jgi:hypothetical protein
VLESKVEELKAKHAYFETVAARLKALESRKNHSIQITAEQSLGDKTHCLLIVSTRVGKLSPAIWFSERIRREGRRRRRKL